MKNKTLGLWLMWTLIAGIITYYLAYEFCGLLMLTNWIFVFIAGARLVSIKDDPDNNKN